MLDRLRNTWEFANLMQYIYLFGKAVKIDEDLDIDVSSSTAATDKLPRFSCGLILDHDDCHADHSSRSGSRARMPQARKITSPK